MPLPPPQRRARHLLHGAATMSHNTRWIVFLGLLSLVIAATAEARLIKLQIDKREIVANGQSFGNAGAYEKLTGTAHFEVDPGIERNAAVFDLGNAPRNDRGHVAFSADMMILKPVDLSKASKTLFFEVNNRGRKIAFMRFHDVASTANINDPMKLEDFGNGFLMRRGYILAWVGWGADIAPGEGRMTVDFPIAHELDKPVTQRILTEFGDRNFNGAQPFTLPLSGGTAFKSYPAIATDRAAAEAELWVVNSDSERPGSATIPRGQRLPDSEWAFAACSNGWPGTPSLTDICVKEGFRNDRNYHLIYRAVGSPVMGLGYVTSRDFVSFLRHEKTDDSGNANPIYGVDTTLCLGISSSGMYMRDFIYQGFNEDEAGKRVCDGVHVHVAGVQKLFLNYRFAQPNPFTQQHRERYVPDTNFPHQYGVRANPKTRIPDGIMKRPSSDPKLIHTDTSNEYWQFRASLTGTTEGGRLDLSENARVRRYLLSSLQHGNFKGDVPNYGLANKQCEQLTNQVHPGPMLRALIVALENWVRKGTPPPASRVPKISDQTLVASEDLKLPKIPGVKYSALINASAERDFGARAKGNRGIIDNLFPDIVYPHRVLVPQVDDLGHDIAGIHHPLIAAPTATYLGWNTRRVEFGGDDLCDLLGSMIPLPKSRELAQANSDPRPSLQELYGDKARYVQRVSEAARKLQSEGLMLEEDFERVIADAQSVKVFDE